MCISTDDWQEFTLKDYSFSNFAPGRLILDIGCGDGVHLHRLLSHGCNAIGVDVDTASIAQCNSLGLAVVQGVAERIPFKSGAFDGVICKVVIPYTDELCAIREIGRVLIGEGVGYCCYHGAGYYLRYLLLSPSWKFRFYGLRTLINTWMYSVSGLRLPGFLGDTLYQSRRRLANYYLASGLHLLKESPSRMFLGFPVFLYHAIRKVSH
jgi:SAM-dependent methyltransferase